jgi:hypothetical protein
MSRRCTANRHDGQPCKAWATKGSDPPLCAAHAKLANADTEVDSREQKKSFYHRTYTIEEVADLIHLAIDHSLDDEVAAARVAVRRVMTQLKEELSPAEYARLATVIFTGTSTIGRLFRTSHELADKRSRELIKAIVKVLDERAKKEDPEL